MPMFLSTVAILLFAPALSSLLVTSFSRASTTPSLHLMPTAVPPFSTALTAYSTWRVSCRSNITGGRRCYLKVAAVRREDRVGQVVTRAYRCLHSC
jgi:hypothetical protein